ncbi:hypothetical protein [Streptomyces sp. NPDC046870]|uniref:hypothetical protein n=1 Tax=Streptomyces sp. NPDC046870 TaxID=3155135 RepID=UPI0034517E77
MTITLSALTREQVEAALAGVPGVTFVDHAVGGPAEQREPFEGVKRLAGFDDVRLLAGDLGG